MIIMEISSAWTRPYSHEICWSFSFSKPGEEYIALQYYERFQLKENIVKYRSESDPIH